MNMHAFEDCSTAISTENDAIHDTQTESYMGGGWGNGDRYGWTDGDGTGAGEGVLQDLAQRKLTTGDGRGDSYFFLSDNYTTGAYI